MVRPSAFGESGTTGVEEFRDQQFAAKGEINEVNHHSSLDVGLHRDAIFWTRGFCPGRFRGENNGERFCRCLLCLCLLKAAEPGKELHHATAASSRVQFESCHDRSQALIHRCSRSVCISDRHLRSIQLCDRAAASEKYS